MLKYVTTVLYLRYSTTVAPRLSSRALIKGLNFKGGPLFQRGHLFFQIALRATQIKWKNRKREKKSLKTKVVRKTKQKICLVVSAMFTAVTNGMKFAIFLEEKLKKRRNH